MIFADTNVTKCDDCRYMEKTKIHEMTSIYCRLIDLLFETNLEVIPSELHYMCPLKNPNFPKVLNLIKKIYCQNIYEVLPHGVH